MASELKQMSTSRFLGRRISSYLQKRRQRRCRYHFIHIPKNGGNTVRQALKRRRDVSTTDPYHYRYRDIADEVGRHLQFFCIVRNPWSRTASRYEFAKQNFANWAEDDPRRLYIATASFEDFVRDRKMLPIPRHPGKPWMGPMNSWFNQLEWIKDENGDVQCDCLRLEYLSQDICRYFDDSIELPNANATRRRYDYREMYNDSLAETVAEIFRDDIDYFGFQFDGAATRNIATL